MAAERERRQNAGAKMASLLNQEDCDDFYKSTYGGFFDIDDDQAFQSPVESDTDEVDSDFDIDERDEPVSNDEDEDNENKIKRRRLVVTKAYKEPVYDKSCKSTVVGLNETSLTEHSGLEPKIPKFKNVRRQRRTVTEMTAHASRTGLVEKKLRHSTLRKSEAAAELRQQQKQERSRAVYSRRPEPEAPLTQEELLEEAKETEIENLKSLERFQQYELEKKKVHRLVKQRCVHGPAIRYFSTTMKTTEGEPYARTFLSFSDDQLYTNIFQCKGWALKNPTSTVEQRRLCAVSGLPASYVDPVTRLPYANLAAFQQLRAAYGDFIAKQGDKNDPAVARWLAYREKCNAGQG